MQTNSSRSRVNPDDLKPFTMRKATSLVTGLFALSSWAQNSMDFDGLDDYASTQNASALIAGSTSISLSLWFHPNHSPAGYPDFDGIAGFRDDIGADFYLLQLAGADMEARFRNSSGTDYSITYNGGLSINDWNHLVLTYNGSLLNLYHDGSLVYSIAASGTISNPSVPFNIGYLPFSSANFYTEGKVDDVALWDRALTASEVSALYSGCGADLNDGDLQLCYEFNQGSAGGNNSSITSITDSKGNINADIYNVALSGSFSNFVGGINGHTYATLNVDECSSYTVPSGSMTYNTSGTYHDTIQNGVGCDSIMTINLTIEEIDTAVTATGDTLTSDEATSGTTYQWIDCSDNSAIAGATDQEFIPDTSGSYAVVVTVNGCTDTSSCHSVTVSGIGIREQQPNTVQAYPNPLADGDILTLQLEYPENEVKVEITNTAGQTIWSGTLEGSESLPVKLEGPAGIYFVRVTSGSDVTVTRVVKQ